MGSGESKEMSQCYVGKNRKRYRYISSDWRIGWTALYLCMTDDKEKEIKDSFQIFQKIKTKMTIKFILNNMTSHCDDLMIPNPSNTTYAIMLGFYYNKENDKREQKQFHL